jgi:hypothetical protein
MNAGKYMYCKHIIFVFLRKSKMLQKHYTFQSVATDTAWSYYNSAISLYMGAFAI